MKLSVIIPIYKVEDYLERCVKSVLNQDYRDLEVILVDDGSPDRCPQICDELAKTDDRIVVVHKQNGGLSSARNAGIEVAKGDYLTFLDSDDQWAKGKLKPLMEQLIEADSTMLFFASLSLSEDGTLLQRNEKDFFTEEFRTLSSIDLYHLLIKLGNLHESACTKIMKRRFLVAQDLKFKQGMLCEDTEWMFRVLRSIDRVSISSIPLFICTENRRGSITNTASTRSVRDMLSIIKGSIKIKQQTPMLSTMEFEMAHCSYLWSICLGIYAMIPAGDKREMRRCLKDVARHLDLSAHPKSKKVSIVYSCCGFRITTIILGLYLKLLRKNIINRKKVQVNG